MLLTPSDQAKLLLAVAGMIARDRLERGVKLNQPEAVALLSCWVIERAREGRTVASLMTDGRSVLTRADVMDGVAELVSEVQVEATFPDGRKLVTLHEPIGAGGPGSGSLPVVVPGKLECAEGFLELNAGRETWTLRVMNTGDRP